MAMWTTRKPAYKVGLGMLFLSTALYIIGFASPFWVYVNWSVYRFYVGLWKWCEEESGNTMCSESFHGNHARTTWFKVAQAMQCLGLIFAVTACVYAVVVNVRRAPRPHGRLLEFLITASGLAGIIGCLIFVGNLVENVDVIAESVSTLEYLSWSFALSVTACILFFITAAVICLGNRDDQTSPGVVVQARAEVPVAVSMQGFASYPGQLAQPVYGYDQVGAAFPHDGSALAAVPPQAGYAASPDYRAGAGGYGRMESASGHDPK